MCSAVDVWPGLLAQQFLGFGVVDQDLIQVFLVQDEEIGKAMGNYICCAPVTPTYSQQTANHRKCGGELDFPALFDVLTSGKEINQMLLFFT